jgi:hypothetical protein
MDEPLPYNQMLTSVSDFKEGLAKALGSRALFTPTELQLDRGISDALREIGEYGISVDSESLPWMLQKIGASSDSFTAGFVAGRMQTNLAAGQAIARADDLLLKISQKYS